MDEKKYNKILSITLENNAMLKKLTADQQNERLTPDEVQKMLDIGKSTYQRYIKDGKVFTQHKLGGKAYVLRSDIEKLIAEGKI
jgi:hypothetical protein|nr:MAG TPA: helix-turn-helix domain protein [Caudoviricetes sp.]